ncbi:MAG: M48 family metallopeptidase [Pseudomonadota bacterium]
MRRPRRGYSRRGGGGGGLGSRFTIVIIGIVGLAIYWFSNQQKVPFSGRSQLNTVSLDQEVKLGFQSYAQILQGEGQNVLCVQGGQCPAGAPELVAEVREIGERLEAAAIELEGELLEEGFKFTPVAEVFEWQYNVILSNQPNAFCLPGGYVAVYTQIMDVAGDFDGTFEPDDDLRDVDKLAVIMGHEIGHALAHHGAERMSQQRITQLGQMAVAVGLGDMAISEQRAVMQAFGMAAQGGLLAFSREHETEADKIGLDLLVRACYDPREAPELWERMGELGSGQRPPEWMSTHPASETRAENFRRWMPDAVAEYERRCGDRSGGF